MDIKRISPRLALARSLRLLLEKTGMSSPEVAKAAGVDRKTVNNQLRGRYDPRPDQIDAVAAVFGYQGHQLLDPHFDPSAENGRLESLAAFYRQADEDGKESILRIAEMAAKYRTAD